jgi:AcrR family transcriptional regulator
MTSLAGRTPVRGPADRPPSIRIVDELRRRIATGELPPNARVPSTRQITQEWGVAMATATKVLTALRHEGLVRAVPGVGTVVVGPDPTPLRADPAALDDGSRSDTGLSRERVIRAGIAVADVEGLAALAMRRIATELGTSTMALYRHVRGKDELLFLMAESVFRSYPLPAPGPDWRAGVEELCRLQWTVYQQHPWLAQYVSMTRPQLIRPAMAHTELVLTMLDRLGLSPAEQLHAAVVLANFVRGTAVNIEPEAQAQLDSGLTSDEWMESQGTQMGEIMASGEFPMFAKVLAPEEVELDLDSLFEFGLHRLLDGLQVMARSGGPAR